MRERIKIGVALQDRQANSRAEFEEISKNYKRWDSFNSAMLKKYFSTDELLVEYEQWSAGSIFMFYERTLGDEIQDLFRTLREKIQTLESIVERLELFLVRTLAPPVAEPVAAASRVLESNRVFIVHGHDDAAKGNLEAILREHGLEPIVLHRQADQGMTVIEKFEKHSDVGYAFILLTPDEISYLAAEEAKPDVERKKERRARPNVIFEFGYFVGKLGRSQVCCLYTGDVTLPTDIGGMLYKRYDKSIEEVAYAMLKDLRAAGYKV